ncbi:hypothetical protein DFR30_0247 [Thiogranum longum]|uniref:Uncharacterized protein n=1 Tax=Thiogranum longum TaxID=1537524 RepID=A0A4R1H5N0_9GAMM|nr:hypothetical protein DFR30_0247 [Thiogranum longum]
MPVIHTVTSLILSRSKLAPTTSSSQAGNFIALSTRLLNLKEMQGFNFSLSLNVSTSIGNLLFYCSFLGRENMRKCIRTSQKSWTYGYNFLCLGDS